MYQLKKIFTLLSVLFVISACGLKGDLYLPEAQPQVVDSTPQDIESSGGTSSEIENASEITSEDTNSDSTQAE